MPGELRAAQRATSMVKLLPPRSWSHKEVTAEVCKGVAAVWGPRAAVEEAVQPATTTTIPHQHTRTHTPLAVNTQGGLSGNREAPTP